MTAPASTRHAFAAVGVFLFAFGAASLQTSAAGEPRQGRIQFSNGDVVEGLISGSPGNDLKVQDGSRLTTTPLDRVQEIRFAPEKETLEQKWRFVEAGRTEKQKWGEPYPVRFVRATLILGGGETLSGHLYTTVLYVEQSNRTQKVVLEYKRRGTEGQRFEDLAYPSRVEFIGPAAEAGSGPRVRIGRTANGPVEEVAALTRPALVRLEGRRQAGDEFLLPPTLGDRIFLAIKASRAVSVGWPSAGDETTSNRVSAALKDARDFFDDRTLLGVWREKPGSDVFSLLMLNRKGATTLGGERTQPWRLAVWRWKEDDSGRLMLAGAGYFFRGILARGEVPPPVRLSPALWGAVESTNAVIEAGE